MKRAATEIGGGGPPSRSTPKPGAADGVDDELESPPSSAGGLAGGQFGSFSSLNSPLSHRRGNSSAGTGKLSSSQVSANSSPSGLEAWSPTRGGISPVNRGKTFFAKHLRLNN